MARILKERLAVLQAEPDWGVTESAIQEMLLSRGHFGIIGAACHAELAYKEHGWARLKAKVKPWVDGKMSTLEEVVMRAIQSIGQRDRLGDAQKCREVMEAYRSIAKEGGTVTAERLNLWEMVHKRHRGVHDTEIADLLVAAGMEVKKQSEAARKKRQSRIQNKKYIEESTTKFQYKLRNNIRKRARRGQYDEAAKRKAKLRRLAYRINHTLDTIKHKRPKLQVK